MPRLATRTLAVALAASVVAATALPAAAQVARPLSAQVTVAADDPVTPVRWRGGWVAGGVAAGLLLGGALAARPYYYGYGAPYGYYDGPPPAHYGEPVYDDQVGYCMRRFKSYDPASGTYMGYDGKRRPCP